MLGKMLSTGFNLATMPARLAYRSVRAVAMTPAEFSELMNELRGASDDVMQEIQQIMASVDDEMGRKTAHLSNEQKQQAALLALDAAEKHLSMAAVNILRALWLAMNSDPQLPPARRGETIEHRR
ncbi:hypothetical protein SAMN05216296_2283 [Pseudomonas pohangensis]|jgi:hypothetical protein|uniref:Uncharacterized protein n=1 Tax=Pseudomonas pohangensis TaxID=364197 RepID=A0A1H2GGX2_9PSED|nr:hypothetical protein [Pseudomonas pohangensis]SDU18742.1 hypothetical protein SAMN05216296_2283 [Pseudomonas pohangensis]